MFSFWKNSVSHPGTMKMDKQRIFIYCLLFRLSDNPINMCKVNNVTIIYVGSSFRTRAHHTLYISYPHHHRNHLYMRWFVECTQVSERESRYICFRWKSSRKSHFVWTIWCSGGGQTSIALYIAFQFGLPRQVEVAQINPNSIAVYCVAIHNKSFIRDLSNFAGCSYSQSNKLRSKVRRITQNGAHLFCLSEGFPFF